MILGEPGDASAPVGSRPWCLALHDKAVRQKKDGKFAVQELRIALLSLCDGGHFHTLTDSKRQPFQSFEDFVLFREPYGLGMDVDVVDAIFREKDGTKALDTPRPRGCRQTPVSRHRRPPAMVPAGHPAEAVRFRPPMLQERAVR